MPEHLPINTREVQAAKEQFLGTDEPNGSVVRESILTSWRRSQASHVRADSPHMPFVREPNLDSPLVVAAAPVLRQLADGLADEEVSVILTSADGVVLTRVSASRVLSRHLDDVQLAPGYSYSEEFVGTNGIGTALETRSPALVMGSEHYAEPLGRLACAGVPIIHPITGALVGALDLTGWVNDGGASLLATLAKTATNQIEGRLLAKASEQETALLNAYLRACRRSPQHGVLAFGHDLVLMNRYLRQALNPQDQAALLEHTVDSATSPTVPTAAPRFVATLPSGQTVRLCSAEDFPQTSRAAMALFHVHLIVDPALTHASAVEQAPSLPGIGGKRAGSGMAVATPTSARNPAGARNTFSVTCSPVPYVASRCPRRCCTTCCTASPPTVISTPPAPRCCGSRCATPETRSPACPPDSTKPAATPPTSTAGSSPRWKRFNSRHMGRTSTPPSVTASWPGPSATPPQRS